MDKNQLAKERRDKAVLESKHAKVATELQIMHENNGKLLEKMKQFSAFKESALKAIDHAKKEMARLKEQHRSEIGSMKKLMKTKLKEAVADTKSHWETERVAMKDELAAAKQEAAGLAETVSRRDKDLRKLKDAESKFQKVLAVARNFQEKNNALEKANAILRKDAEKVSEIKKMHDAHVQKKLKQCVLKLDAAEKETKDKTDKAKILLSQLAKEKKASSELQDRVEQLKDQYTRYKRIQKDVAKLKEAEGNLKASMARCEREKKDWEAKHQDLSDQFQQLQKVAQKKSSDVNKLKKEYESLEVKHREQKKVDDFLKKKVKAYDKIMDKLNNNPELMEMLFERSQPYVGLGEGDDDRGYDRAERGKRRGKKGRRGRGAGSPSADRSLLSYDSSEADDSDMRDYGTSKRGARRLDDNYLDNPLSAYGDGRRKKKKKRKKKPKYDQQAEPDDEYDVVVEADGTRKRRRKKKKKKKTKTKKRDGRGFYGDDASESSTSSEDESSDSDDLFDLREDVPGEYDVVEVLRADGTKERKKRKKKKKKSNKKKKRRKDGRGFNRGDDSSASDSEGYDDNAEPDAEFDVVVEADGKRRRKRKKGLKKKKERKKRKQRKGKDGYPVFDSSDSDSSDSSEDEEFYAMDEDVEGDYDIVEILHDDGSKEKKKRKHRRKKKKKKKKRRNDVDADSVDESGDFMANPLYAHADRERKRRKKKRKKVGVEYSDSDDSADDESDDSEDAMYDDSAKPDADFDVIVEKDGKRKKRRKKRKTRRRRLGSDEDVLHGLDEDIGEDFEEVDLLHADGSAEKKKRRKKKKSKRGRKDPRDHYEIRFADGKTRHIPMYDDRAEADDKFDVVVEADGRRKRRPTRHFKNKLRRQGGVVSAYTVDDEEEREELFNMQEPIKGDYDVVDVLHDDGTVEKKKRRKKKRKKRGGRGREPHLHYEIRFGDGQKRILNMFDDEAEADEKFDVVVDKDGKRQRRPTRKFKNRLKRQGGGVGVIGDDGNEESEDELFDMHDDVQGDYDVVSVLHADGTTEKKKRKKGKKGKKSKGNKSRAANDHYEIRFGNGQKRRVKMYDENATPDDKFDVIIEKDGRKKRRPTLQFVDKLKKQGGRVSVFGFVDDEPEEELFDLRDKIKGKYDIVEVLHADGSRTQKKRRKSRRFQSKAGVRARAPNEHYEIKFGDGSTRKINIYDPNAQPDDKFDVIVEKDGKRKRRPTLQFKNRLERQGGAISVIGVDGDSEEEEELFDVFDKIRGDYDVVDVLHADGTSQKKKRRKKKQKNKKTRAPNDHYEIRFGDGNKRNVDMYDDTAKPDDNFDVIVEADGKRRRRPTLRLQNKLKRQGGTVGVFGFDDEAEPEDELFPIQAKIQGDYDIVDVLHADGTTEKKKRRKSIRLPKKGKQARATIDHYEIRFGDGRKKKVPIYDDNAEPDANFDIIEEKDGRRRRRPTRQLRNRLSRQGGAVGVFGFDDEQPEPEDELFDMRDNVQGDFDVVSVQHADGTTEMKKRKRSIFNTRVVPDEKYEIKYTDGRTELVDMYDDVAEPDDKFDVIVERDGKRRRRPTRQFRQSLFEQGAGIGIFGFEADSEDEEELFDLHDNIRGKYDIVDVLHADGTVEKKKRKRRKQNRRRDLKSLAELGFNEHYAVTYGNGEKKLFNMYDDDAKPDDKFDVIVEADGKRKRRPTLQFKHQLLRQGGDYGVYNADGDSDEEEELYDMQEPIKGDYDVVDVLHANGTVEKKKRRKSRKSKKGDIQIPNGHYEITFPNGSRKRVDMYDDRAKPDANFDVIVENDGKKKRRPTLQFKNKLMRQGGDIGVFGFDLESEDEDELFDMRDNVQGNYDVVNVLHADGTTEKKKRRKSLRNRRIVPDDRYQIRFPNGSERFVSVYDDSAIPDANFDVIVEKDGKRRRRPTLQFQHRLQKQGGSLRVLGSDENKPQLQLWDELFDLSDHVVGNYDVVDVLRADGSSEKKKRRKSLFTHKQSAQSMDDLQFTGGFTNVGGVVRANQRRTGGDPLASLNGEFTRSVDEFSDYRSNDTPFTSLDSIFGESTALKDAKRAKKLHPHVRSKSHAHFDMPSSLRQQQEQQVQPSQTQSSQYPLQMNNDDSYTPRSVHMTQPNNGRRFSGLPFAFGDARHSISVPVQRSDRDEDGDVLDMLTGSDEYDQMMSGVDRHRFKTYDQDMYGVLATINVNFMESGRWATPELASALLM